MDNLIPTIAFELRDAAHERAVRSFWDAVDDVDYYILRGEGANEGITSYAVLVISSGSMEEAGRAIAPRS